MEFGIWGLESVILTAEQACKGLARSCVVPWCVSRCLNSMKVQIGLRINSTGEARIRSSRFHIPDSEKQNITHHDVLVSSISLPCTSDTSSTRIAGAAPYGPRCNRHCFFSGACHGSGPSSVYQSDRVRVARTDPSISENLLTRPQSTREISDTS